MHDQLGALNDALLRFTAPVTPATLQLCNHVSGGQSISMLDDICLQVDAFQGQIRPLNIRLDRFVGCQKDLDNLLIHPVAAVCHVSASERGSLWLILATVRRPGLFRRVGCFQTSWFRYQDLPVEMITVI